jgi:hypothetical protein
MVHMIASIVDRGVGRVVASATAAFMVEPCLLPVVCAAGRACEVLALAQTAAVAFQESDR